MSEEAQIESQCVRNYIITDAVATMRKGVVFGLNPDLPNHSLWFAGLRINTTVDWFIRGDLVFYRKSVAVLRVPYSYATAFFVNEARPSWYFSPGSGSQPNIIFDVGSGVTLEIPCIELHAVADSLKFEVNGTTNSGGGFDVFIGGQIISRK